MTTTLNERSAIQLAGLIGQGKCSAVDIAEACLARIAERERDVQAWAYIDADAVLAQARARDREAPRSVLHGIPVGVKDVIETFDMPTEYGSTIYARHRPQRDAACVALLREAGAVILGKTVTVELAAFHYARTRNPHDLNRTPGGSSSGSAAAVADFMVPLALGNQTGGSTIRPAAFCGIVGYKPSFNLINRAGMKPLAESQDTVGLLARTLGDVAAILAILTACPLPDLSRQLDPPRIAVCRMPEWPALDGDMAAAMQNGAARLAHAGAHVREIDLPHRFAASLIAQRKMNDYEAWRALSYERIYHRDELSPTLAARLDEAACCTYEDYRDAQDIMSECRAILDGLFAEYDVLVTPTTPGVAPLGLSNTGDSNYIRIWTALHTPTITLPVFRGEQDLPLGLQVIGPYREDARTLQAAAWIDRTLA